ncbi:hypothetical protein MKW92_044679 [Papaver armeniacum]|nr:hypothetical protein MKW92_044679 [Papaver armeniacum]
MGKCWHTEDAEEENGSGNCKTSGNQITCDVQIGVSPPNSPKQPPTNESKGFPNTISPEQVDPGSHSKINGLWKKGKRLQSTEPGLNSNYLSRNGNELSSPSSKTTLASVPPTPRSEGEILQSSNIRSFRFSDLETATRKFNNLLREGEFERVFKGWIDENTFTATEPGTGIVIAVKLLNSPERFQDQSKWLAEVNYLGQVYHPNLVKLIGYCAENGNRILVYEYTPHGSLEDHLYRLSNFQPLSWNVRMKVALGAAKGLAFLDSAETKVIFRDFKTSNILLDSTYNAKLSDFEFAKDYPGDKSPTGDQSHVSTRVMVNREYVAPEYLATGHLTASSNVYSFGVVFLEMLCGRKAIDIFRPSGEDNLIEWAKPYLPRKVSTIIDTRVEGQYTQPEALKAGNLVLQCLSVDPKYRPTMEKVVASLERLQDSEGPTSSKPSLCSVM